jgi:hypothetical protein
MANASRTCSERPRHHRRLRYMFCMTALTSLRVDGRSRDYYQRKRREGRNHKDADAPMFVKPFAWLVRNRVVGLARRSRGRCSA